MGKHDYTWVFVADMKDLSILEDLDRPNEHLSSVWALMPSASPKPRSLADDPKGSRFAKFIADKQFLKQTSPLDKTAFGSPKILPSKM